MEQYQYSFYVSDGRVRPIDLKMIVFICALVKWTLPAISSKYDDDILITLAIDRNYYSYVLSAK